MREDLYGIRKAVEHIATIMEENQTAKKTEKEFIQAAGIPFGFFMAAWGISAKEDEYGVSDASQAADIFRAELEEVLHGPYSYEPTEHEMALSRAEGGDD